MTNSYLRSFVEDQKDKHDDGDAPVGQPKKTSTRVRMTKAQEARAAAVKDMLEYDSNLPRFSPFCSEKKTREIRTIVEILYLHIVLMLLIV